MKKGFYAKLAFTGIRKNRRLYIPYILTCIGMVMMFYIVAFLSDSSVLTGIKGGDIMQSMLSLGTGVIGVFALIFLFYTNSFLMRRRKREFGLYNILGMGKGNLARVLLWESVMIAVISLGGGLLAGIALSKIAELGMVNLLQGDVNFTLTLEPEAIVQTLLLFSVIFLLLLLNTLRQIRLANPIALLHSENTGEKPPKANWLAALLGAVLLGGAYYLAVTIENPVQTLIWFFVAVIMVIIASYLLFVAGSVVICKLLQKKKSYYYKTNHFVSVSSMAYRMKRNGAGLASICILCTMVLVMISSTVCLYIGAEDSMRTRYPRNINLDITFKSLEDMDGEKPNAVRQIVEKTAAESGESLQNVLDYRVAGFAAYMKNGLIETNSSHLENLQLDYYSDVWQIFIVPVSDYNRLMGENETLSEGEALIYTTKSSYPFDTISLGGRTPLKVKKTVSDFADNGVDAMQIIPSVYLFVSDFDSVIEPLLTISDPSGKALVGMHWYYGFDLLCDDETQITIQENLLEKLRQSKVLESGGASVSCEGVAQERSGFYGLYGGLFFLGILLGVVFLFAAVLIIYYKQISEGYEDQSRFAIMQKIGMTKKEIRKSINSQVLTVFFMPLITAGVHLAFAFPMIYKLLMLFSLTNQRLLIFVTICCFLIFTLFYVLVYRITSKAYYSIVSGAKEERG
ncbi:MAG: FtsX-like permease family protein [Oscillospiraceae bacterium]|nr:FtsX-like permease family protein [Oscillospiraceae bacterium]MDY3064349.1 FtsX-like permease family protein [Oscillospiraceae bacterium]